MLQVGLTGGIGSGKTYIGKVFSTLGVPVFDADKAGKTLLDSDPDTIRKVKQLFGPQIYSPNSLDRKKVADLVFRNKSKLDQLNAIIHPAVISKYKNWLRDYKDSPYIIMEAAILYESGANEYLDLIILVSAPQTIRIQRVVDRDGSTPEEIQSRMSHQIPEIDLINRSDYNLVNDGQRMVLPQVLDIHNHILER